MTEQASRPAGKATATSYDFDLHRLVGIRLLDASPEDVATVERQLGPLKGRLTRDPDITVRFVDSATDKPLTYVGLGDGGFNEDGFFVLRGRGGAPGKAMIPFDRIGQQPEIVCERRMPAVPHLLALINQTALRKGVLPLHASAFTTADGTGVLVVGWAKGGKTESLLGSMADGADYVGDEWVYLTSDGRMVGLPEPIRLWAWHLRQMSSLLAARPPRERVRLSAWQSAAEAFDKAAGGTWPGVALVRKGAPLVARQAYLQVPPAELFGADAMKLRGRCDAVVLVLIHDSDQIVVADAGPAEISGRMAASLIEERAAFLAHYHQFCYAFPKRTSAAVSAAETVERELLRSLLDHRPGAKVLHPYPCDIRALGRTVRSAAADALQAGRA